MIPDSILSCDDTYQQLVQAYSKNLPFPIVLLVYEGFDSFCKIIEVFLNKAVSEKDFDKSKIIDFFLKDNADRTMPSLLHRLLEYGEEEFINRYFIFLKACIERNILDCEDIKNIFLYSSRGDLFKSIFCNAILTDSRSTVIFLLYHILDIFCNYAEFFGSTEKFAVTVEQILLAFATVGEQLISEKLVDRIYSEFIKKIVELISSEIPLEDMCKTTGFMIDDYCDEARSCATTPVVLNVTEGMPTQSEIFSTIFIRDQEDNSGTHVTPQKDDGFAKKTIAADTDVKSSDSLLHRTRGAYFFKESSLGVTFGMSLDFDKTNGR